MIVSSGIFCMNSNDVSDLVIIFYNLQSLRADTLAGKIRTLKVESKTIHFAQARRPTLDERSEKK